jgi:hypothetical protein
MIKSSLSGTSIKGILLNYFTVESIGMITGQGFMIRKSQGGIYRTYWQRKGEDSVHMHTLLISRIFY